MKKLLEKLRATGRFERIQLTHNPDDRAVKPKFTWRAEAEENSEGKANWKNFESYGATPEVAVRRLYKQIVAHQSAER